MRSIDFRTDLADAAADSSLVSVQNFTYQFYYELQIENFREGFIFAKFREIKTLGKGENTHLFTDVGKSCFNVANISSRFSRKFRGV